MSKFKLKEGKMIQISGTYYTNDNLTDEKAIEILTKFPSHAGTFSEKPEGWKKMCEVKEEPTGREAELLKMGQKDLLEMAIVIAEAYEDLSKPRHNTGIPKLVEFVLKNEKTKD